MVGGDLLHEQAVETQRLIARQGGTALTPGTVDVTDEDSVRSWAQEAVDAFRGIDIVYANADTVRFGPVDSQPHDDFTSAVRAELKSVWLTAHATWSHLIRSCGCILTADWTPVLGGSLTNRRTAKDGVIALTRRIAVEGAPYGIRANCITPSTIDTASPHADPLPGTIRCATSLAASRSAGSARPTTSSSGRLPRLRRSITHHRHPSGRRSRLVHRAAQRGARKGRPLP